MSRADLGATGGAQADAPPGRPGVLPGPQPPRPPRRWFGTRCEVPPAWRHTLAQVFALDPAVIARVQVRAQSRFAAWHAGAAATTRPDRIYLAGDAAAFWDDPALVLHEYAHVLLQWRSGRLTRRAYLWQLLRRGYRGNRFEIEAQAFARQQLGPARVALAAQAATVDGLNRAGVPGGTAPAPLRARG